MFIKRTKVNTPHGRKTYLQIVQSYYDHGRVRQRLIVSLGEESTVDLTVAKGLLASLNAGLNDSLPSEQIAMLNAKNFGELYLLHNIYVKTGLSRFFGDLGKFYGLSNLSDALFFLSAYTVFCRSDAVGIKAWLDSYYLLGKTPPTVKDLQDAIKILRRENLVSSAVRSVQLKERPKPEIQYHFLCDIQYRCKASSSQSNRYRVTTSSDMRIQSVCRWDHSVTELQEGDYVICEASSDISGLITMLQKKKLTYLLRLLPSARDSHWEDAIQEAAENSALAVALGANRLKEGSLNGMRFIMVQPVSEQDINAPYKESNIYELLLTNSTKDLRSLWDLITFYDKTAEHLYNFVLPKDMALNGLTIEKILPNLSMIRLVMMYHMENLLPPEWLGEDVLELFKEIHAAEVFYRNGTRVYHTDYTPVQRKTAAILGILPEHLHIYDL